MGSLETQKGKSLAKVHTASKWQSWDVGPSGLPSEPRSYLLDLAAFEDGHAFVSLASSHQPLASCGIRACPGEREK